MIFRNKPMNYLKNMQKNTLNPYRCKFNPVALASHYFYKHCPKSITYADPFVEHEEKWLIKAMSGGLTYAEPSKLSTGFEYDINSMYPYLMTQCQYLNGQPVFHFISDLKNIKEDTYCIIRCKITSHNKKLFRRNKNNYYCGLDVKNALEEGYKIELIHDLRPNYMYYPKNTMIPGKEVFGRFVKDMYKMKLNGAPFSKVVLNCLWGKLFEKDVYEVESKYNKQIDVDHINQVKKIFSYFNEEVKTNYKFRIYRSLDTKYKLKHIQGRFVPFMTCLGRYKMKHYMKPHLKHIKRIHTDGFISDTPLDIDCIGNKLGQFKCKSAKCTIQNVNIVKWNL